LTDGLLPIFSGRVSLSASDDHDREHLMAGKTCYGPGTVREDEAFPREQLATAHLDWDRRWTVADERARWERPESFVEALVPHLRKRGFRRAIDIGCGIGRHALYLASEGFECMGIDASESGLAHARAQAQQAGLSIDFRQAPFFALPVEDHSFEIAIAWNVVYHGDGEITRRAIEEVRRVLVPGGVYIGTQLSKRNANFGQGREVQPDTFVVDNVDTDKAHPHFYCDAPTLLRLHRGFEVLELRDREQQPGAYHWEFVFESLAEHHVSQASTSPNE
jgi:tellurite methyltransferase